MLSALLIAAQLADMLWPRSDERAGTAATLIVVTVLGLLLALYPDGRPVPRWTLIVVVLMIGLFCGNLVIGPDAAARFLWPLPLVPLLLLLIGSQGYRYLRRSDTSEREAAR